MADAQADTGTAPQTDQISDQNATARAAATAAATNAAKRKNRGNLRKRSAADSDEETGAGTTNKNKNNDDANGGGGEAVRRAQKPREAPLAFTTKREDKTETFKFESSGAAQIRNDGGATRALETETEYDRDNRAIKERMIQQAAELQQQDQEGGPGPRGANGDDAPTAGEAVYRGMTGYKDYRAGFRRENTVGGHKATGTHGPLRASAHVRMSIRVDYQPDICKDYKETGYCGFGDSCKFLHDRGDYKAGWEIDRDWEEKQKAQRERMLAGIEGGDSGDDGDKDGEDDEEELPFACFICRRSWSECQDPVVTRCKHYFCEQCALQHNAKSKKCFVCEQPTGGIFNVANDILKRERENKRKAAESAGGG
jgi:RING finger protein 113A